MHRFQQFLAAPLRFGDAVKAALVFQHFERREKGIEDDLLRNDPDGSLRIARVIADIEAPDFGAAAGLPDQTCENIDKGGFACAIRTQQSENATLRDIEAYPLQRKLGLFAGAGRCIFLDEVVDAYRWGSSHAADLGAARQCDKRRMLA